MVAVGAHGSYLVTIHTMGLDQSASAEFNTACTLQLCVIQLGVEEPNGTISWLPGYAYPGTPISQCQNKTDVLGQDVLDRTIMTHQFIQNRTLAVPIPIQETLPPI